MDITLTTKQTNCLDALEDINVTEILFGGGAGGAKSFVGCLWIIMCCYRYKGTRWLLGRAKLKALKQTTLETFFEVLTICGIDKSHYNYNSQIGEIEFSNGSKVILKDLFLYPSDPNFDSLGSLEITGAFIDEVNQIVYKAVQIVGSRIRYKLKNFDIHGEETINMKVLEYDSNGMPSVWLNSKGEKTEGLVPTRLMSCNPAKNWTYAEFYKPWKDGTLKKHRRFIQALAKDNKYISKHYIEELKKLDKNSRERLYNGNWEYDDDPTRLFEIDSICDMWTNTFVTGGSNYISCDVARKGNDDTVIFVFEGLRVIHAEAHPKTLVDETIALIEKARKRFFVSKRFVIVDEDGVGGGVVDCGGYVGFTNGAKPIAEDSKTNFAINRGFRANQRA
jgi:phage terminase large subunit